MSEQILNEQICAVILAGGKSTRMGQDKSFLMLNNMTFIEVISETLKKSFSDVYISSNKPEIYYSKNQNIIIDLYSETGPLSGIFSSLKFVSQEYIFLSTCDIPLLTTEMISHIIKSSIPGMINIVITENDKYPLLGIYPKSITSQLDYFIKDNKRKVFDFLESLKDGYNKIDLTIYRRFLMNINNSEDYRNLTKIIEEDNF